MRFGVNENRDFTLEEWGKICGHAGTHSADRAEITADTQKSQPSQAAGAHRFGVRRGYVFELKFRDPRA
jgi:hypothetical protein